ncbi:hypothetical protein [Algoriphagus formosus]|uniref:hypothetical protein n=1 Tax=Algoriphagus formosus TaxID=2007308 RepID=UPI003F71CEC3
MEIRKEPLDFEKVVGEIVGLRVSSVSYYSRVDKKITSKCFQESHFKQIDSVDFSVIIQCHNNNKIEILWDSSFFHYGIGLKINENSPFEKYQITDVSDSIIWSNTIGQTIENVTINWDVAIEENLDGSIIRKILYPQSLVLIFSNSNIVFISAAGFLERDDEQVYPYLDKLTITNNEALAIKTRMIPLGLKYFI